MRKGVGAAAGTLMLVALTAAVGVWSWRNTSTAQVAVAAVRATPAVPTTHVIRARQAPSEFQAGVSVVVYGNDPYFQLKAQVLLNQLAALGANSVSFVVPIFQDGVTASQVYADPLRTPNDAKIAVFAAEAQRRGFTVMLRPLLDIGKLENATDWRGSIRPQNPAQWNQSYTDLMMAYARLAEVNHVAVFDIGSELDSRERDTGYWQRLITAARGVYHGQITYSSNWAKLFPVFGGSLDFISVDAYFPLGKPTTATTGDLVNAWQPWITRLDRIRRSFGKPLVLSELGATSLVGSFQQPWIWDNGQPVDLTAQQRYYQAACQSVVPRFSGVYWWLYSLDPPAKPALDRSFAVAGKPAEADLRACFTSAPWVKP